MPTIRMVSIVIVVDVRVKTAAKAHQDSTGIWAPSISSPTRFMAETSVSMRAKLWISAMLPRVSDVGSGQHDLHQPARMRARMVGKRQLQHVLEIIRAHLLAMAVCEPVGVERHHGTSHDNEYAEGHPGDDQGQQIRPGDL